MPSGTRPTEELIAAPLPELIRDLGLAIATANKALAEAQAPTVFSIASGEIEVNVAISVQKTTDASVGGSLNLHAFSVNASYKSTYGFKEEASSRIKIVVQARPQQEKAGA